MKKWRSTPALSKVYDALIEFIEFAFNLSTSELEIHFHTGLAKGIENGAVCIGNVFLSPYHKADITKIVVANGYLMFTGGHVLMWTNDAYDLSKPLSFKVKTKGGLMFAVSP
jgi:hypothetical protein